MPDYLVTGGAGFIGSNIVEALVEQGESVRVLDDCSTGSLLNLEEVIGQMEFVKGDVQHSFRTMKNFTAEARRTQRR